MLQGFFCVVECYWLNPCMSKVVSDQIQYGRIIIHSHNNRFAASQDVIFRFCHGARMEQQCAAASILSSGEMSQSQQERPVPRVALNFLERSFENTLP